MRGMADASVDLVYADPPYICTGRDFGAFDDRWPSREAYLAFMRSGWRRFTGCVRPHEQRVSLHCDAVHKRIICGLLDDVFGERNFRNENAWCYANPWQVTRGIPA